MDVQGNIVDIEKRRIYPGTVTVKNGKIFAIAPLPQSDTAVDPFRPFIMPGFVDSHIHLEMTHVIPSEYVTLALASGTIAAVADCHDIVNVLGRKGEEALMKNVKKLPFYFGFSAPSTLVKGRYELSDVAKLLAKKEVTNLGELQNFPDVLLHERWVEEELALARKYKKPIDGSAPGLSKDKLTEYCASGITTDHWCASEENAREKIQNGMTIIMQIKKLDSLMALVPLFKEYGDKLMFSGQNMYAPALGNKYINQAAAEMIASGADLFGVLRAACITPVKLYNLPTGTLHVGDSADFILVKSLEHLSVTAAYVKGSCVYSKSRDYPVVNFRHPKMRPLNNFKATPLCEKDVLISAVASSTAKSHSCELKPAVNVIAVCDGEVNTVRDLVFMPEKDGFINSDVSQDCIKVVVYDRYNGKTKPIVGFVRGFGIKTGGAAMSVSHDAHNIVAVGVEDKDIAIAINRVVAMRGGIALSVRGKVRADLPFPIAGLMSNLPLEEVTKRFSTLHKLFNGEMGCKLLYPIETLSYIASPQLPSLKITLNGLMNVVEQEIVPLVP